MSFFFLHLRFCFALVEEDFFRSVSRFPVDIRRHCSLQAHVTVLPPCKFCGKMKVVFSCIVCFVHFYFVFVCAITKRAGVVDYPFVFWQQQTKDDECNTHGHTKQFRWTRTSREKSGTDKAARKMLAASVGGCVYLADGGRQRRLFCRHLKKENMQHPRWCTMWKARN